MTKCLLLLPTFLFPQARQPQTGASPLLYSCPSLPQHLRPPCSCLPSPPAAMPTGPHTWYTQTSSCGAGRWWGALPRGETCGTAEHRLPAPLGPPQGEQSAKPEPAGMAGVRNDATQRFQALHPYSQGTAVLLFVGMLKALAY